MTQKATELLMRLEELNQMVKSIDSKEHRRVRKRLLASIEDYHITIRKISPDNSLLTDTYIQLDDGMVTATSGLQHCIQMIVVLKEEIEKLQRHAEECRAFIMNYYSTEYAKVDQYLHGHNYGYRGFHGDKEKDELYKYIRFIKDIDPKQTLLIDHWWLHGENSVYENESDYSKTYFKDRSVGFCSTPSHLRIVDFSCFQNLQVLYLSTNASYDLRVLDELRNPQQTVDLYLNYDCDHFYEDSFAIVPANRVDCVFAKQFSVMFVGGSNVSLRYYFNACSENPIIQKFVYADQPKRNTNTPSCIYELSPSFNVPKEIMDLNGLPAEYLKLFALIKQNNTEKPVCSRFESVDEEADAISLICRHFQ